MTSAPESDPRPARAVTRHGPRAPWRSAAAGWVALAVILAAGLPLFLRMPLWIDVTLYDLAARAVLNGGVHYRDVFDSNPPGFMWAMCAIRTLFGPSPEAVRAVDALTVTAVVALLLRLARGGGATPAGVAWAAAGAAGFYLFVSEFNHAQRDVWMMLPALGAVAYRLWRVDRSRGRAVTDGWVFGTALLEGAVWGVGAWVKPHVVLIAAAVWVVTRGRLAGTGGRPVRRTAADLTGALAGGLLVGAAGVAWLVATGTWPYLYDVFTRWNPGYVGTIFGEFTHRCQVQLEYFPPWSLLVLAATPLALLNLVMAACAAPTPADADRRFRRGVLAAVYLAWAGVALVIQKNYHYVHVPETLLMLGVFAANRWAVAFPVLCVQAAVMVWLAAAGETVGRWEDHPLPIRLALWQYPDGHPNRFRWWPGCFARDVPGTLRNGVAFQTDAHSGINWAELEDVAGFLRSQGVRPGDATVLCWHDSPHALYLELGLRPPIRFMHLSTALGMSDEAYGRVKAEVTAAAPGVRFVVSDLARVGLNFPPGAKARMTEPGPGPDLLPPVVPPACRDVFPLNQPTVFRSGGGRGRYVVHVLTNPVGEVYVPGWPDPPPAPLAGGRVTPSSGR